MAALARVVAVGAAHHVRQRGLDLQRIFFTNADCHTYLDCLQPTLRKLAFAFLLIAAS